MSSKHDGSSQAPHLRVIHGGDDGEDEEILEDGFHVIDDDGPVSDPWLKAGGDPSESDPPGVVVDTDPTVLEDDFSLPPARDLHEETKPEIPQPALDARRRGVRPPPADRGPRPPPDDTSTEPGPEEMATVPRAPMPEPRGAIASSTALPSAQLRVLEGPDVGTTFPLDEPVVTVGRSSECQVTLRDLSMSRKHAEIRRAGRRAFEIRDLDSRNGTTVDGRAAKVWIAAAPGAIVQVGDVRLRLEVEDLSEPTLLRPGSGIAAGPLDPPLPPPPKADPAPRPRAPRAPAPRSAPAPRTPPAPRSPPAPRAPAPGARRGPFAGGKAGAGRRGPAASGPPPGPLGTLAKGALAVALGAGISWLLAWLVFFASFAPLRSRPAAPPPARGPSPTAALAPHAPPPAAPEPAAPTAAPTAAATALAAAQAAVSRQDWVVAVHEARLVPEAAPEHPAADEILHSVREDVVDPRLDKARDQIAAHHPDAAEATLLSTLAIWPKEKTAVTLLAKARADERAALAPPKPHRKARHRTRRHRTRHHVRHLARHATPRPAPPPADDGLLRKAREAFAGKHLHSAIAAADAAADLGGSTAVRLDKDLHAFESSWNTASRTRDIATALASYTDALYRARHIAPPSGGDYGVVIRRALGQAHYVAALQAQKAGQNQLAISHAQKALGYDPGNRGARSLLHALMR